MRLLVTGSAGKVGQRLVAEALEHGHEVTAFARLGPSGEPDGRLRTLAGDMRDRGLVESALADREAVLWTPGRVVLAHDLELSEGLRTLVASMETRGPRRLVFLSSLEAGETRRRATVFSAMFLLGLFRGDLVRDAERLERRVSESRLDWTIIRPGTLFDGPRSGTSRLGFGAADVPAEARVSFADVADFMLRQATDGDYVRAVVDLFDSPPTRSRTPPPPAGSSRSAPAAGVGPSGATTL